MEYAYNHSLGLKGGKGDLGGCPLLQFFYMFVLNNQKKNNMKKNLFINAAVLCCAVSILALTACGNEENVNYVKSYSYSISQSNRLDFTYYDQSESSDILDALNTAIGANGSIYNTLSSPDDQRMINACNNVVNRYSNIKSVYLVFDLVRETYDPAPEAGRKVDVIKTYKLGKALTEPYVTYSFTSNSEEAFAELENKKESLDEKVYKATRRSLIQLVGRHYSSGGIYGGISSAFEGRFRGALGSPYKDNTDDQNYLVHVCDSIAQAHLSDTLAVKAVVNVCKTDILDEQQISIIKTYEFPVNVE